MLLVHSLYLILNALKNPSNNIFVIWRQIWSYLGYGNHEKICYSHLTILCVWFRLWGGQMWKIHSLSIPITRTEGKKKKKRTKKSKAAVLGRHSISALHLYYSSSLLQGWPASLYMRELNSNPSHQKIWYTHYSLSRDKVK